MSPSVKSTQSAPGRPPVEPGPYPRAPWPENTPAHALLVIDYAKIAAGDEAEADTLFKACSTLGFFYLKVRSLLRSCLALGQSMYDANVSIAAELWIRGLRRAHV